jgi:hypothetical protein
MSPKCQDGFHAPELLAGSRWVGSAAQPTLFSHARPAFLAVHTVWNSELREAEWVGPTSSQVATEEGRRD